MENLISAESILNIITAKKNNNGAEFTVVSKKTGKDYTFKIARKEWKGKYYTHVKVEMGYLNFVYLGSYFTGKLFRKSKQVVSPAATAISWILEKVSQHKFTMLNENVEIKHLGSCLRCGRTLTDNESIKFGLGPVCRNN